MWYNVATKQQPKGVGMLHRVAIENSSLANDVSHTHASPFLL